MDETLRRLRVIATEILLPALLLVSASQLLFDSDPVIGLLAKYRPTAGQSTLELNVSRQELTSNARLRVPASEPRVVIVGSSAVVNGVDADVVREEWGRRAFAGEPINLGQTGLVAYELVLLKRYTLHPTVETVVFLYNSFSFADRLLGTVVGVRWDTAEMLALQPPDLAEPLDWRRYATGIVNENLAIVRYGVVAKSIVMRALRGTLEPVPYFPDFPPEPTLNAPREREAEEPAPDGDWLRAAYLDSQHRPDTLGYRGFERFLDRARQQGVRVIVAPVPEPEFSLINRWRVGTDPTVVDARVAAIAVRHGAAFWPRERVADFERDDTLFRDQTHFNRFGRERYSRVLAAWIAADSD